jgi:hypothetical protein
MADNRMKNQRWNIGSPDSQQRWTWDQIKIAMLMDIRDELQSLNRLLHCQNFLAIPRKLDAIHRKLPTRRKRKAKP